MAGTTDELKAALLGLRKLRARVAELEGAASAPIAVVGMAGRFPGGVEDPDALWRALREGRDLVGPAPADRLDTSGLTAPVGGFLDDVARFDHELFGISPREARAMDPQQRLLLETAWAALEDAGRLGLAEGSATGVYLGVALTDWEQRTLYHPDAETLDLYSGTGVLNSIAAGRISYALGLKGPAISLDTACSSSLVAAHLAMAALRAGEVDTALAGGVNLVLSPEASRYFQLMGALSPTGRCRAFDAGADGYVRSEAVGIVVLRRLSDALADGDRVLAVLRGSAVNQDGRSNGLTAPSPEAQREVLRRALAASGLPASAVGMVAAHGTGTPLGDPIEVAAIAEVYGAGDGTCAVTANKSSVGHAEAAAGVVGLIAAVQAVRYGEIPPNVHLNAVNPRLATRGTRLSFPTAAVSWASPRAAGVSSFGMSGTNAHLVLSEAPEVAPTAHEGPALLRLSAASSERLAALARSTASALRAGVALPDAAFTLATGRLAQSHRVAVVASSSDKAADALEAWASGVGSSAVSGVAGRAPKVGLRVCQSGQAATVERLRGWGITPAGLVGIGEGAADAAQASADGSSCWLASDDHGLNGKVDRIDDLDGDPLGLAAALWVAGVPVGDTGDGVRRRVKLPGTTFEGPKLWIEAPVARGRAVDPFAWTERWEPVASEPTVSVAAWSVVGDDALATALGGRSTVLGASFERGERRVVAGPVAVSDLAAALVAAADAGASVVRVSEREDEALGLFAVAAQEVGDAVGGWLSVEPGTEVSDVVAAVRTLRGEDRRVTPGGRFARRLVRSNEGPPSGELPASVWIAGGTGAIGQALAAWLVERGVSGVVLLSRRGGAVSDALNAAGVLSLAVDARDAGALEALRVSHGAPDAVVHLAGSLGDGPIRGVRASDFEAADKRAAAEALASVLPDARLLLVGSATVSLGIPGQAAYAAANAALRDRVGSGRASLVELGPVQGGMADAATRARLSALGIGALPMAVAVDRLGRALGTVGHRSIVIDLDAARYAAVASGARIAGLLGAHTPAALAVDVADAVRAELAAVLGLADPATIDPRRGLFDIGLDSMTATALARALSSRLGREVPLTIAFDHPDLASLIAWAEASSPARAVEVTTRARSTDDRIAVVGMACRFPGGDDPEAFWRFLLSGDDAVGPVPPDRWSVERWYDATPGVPGKTYVRTGAFLRDVSGFDPSFFGISPKEAAVLDPQQRLLLELAVEALEDAAIPRAGLVRRPVGVYLGIGPSDYARRFDPRVDAVDPYVGTGNEASFAAGRVAYALGLQGPALGLNTACSTTLVAAHLAAQALRDGECDVALTGGVHLMLAPDSTIQLCQLQALSPGGRCRVFDAAADGYARGEGAGMLVLKRLSDAEAAGDRVLAVLAATAVNHDGPSAGLTVPSGSAQAALLRTALTRAGWAPEQVGYLETHGTGTRLGDPIELGAVREVYGQRSADRPLRLGAAKGHVGHLELAAGSVGLISAIQALRHGEVPGLSHLQTLNPALNLDFPVVLPTRRVAWAEDGPRRAAVSSFGLSGTNAHALLEQAPERAAVGPSLRSHHLLTLSAASPSAVRGLARRLADTLRRPDAEALADVGHTLLVGRDRAAWRATVVAADAEAAATALEALADSGLVEAGGAARPVVGLLTGQGAQHPAMLLGLAAAWPVVADTLAEADAVLTALRGRTLRELLAAGDPLVHDTAWTQPLLVVAEVAVGRLWASLGVRFSALLGHSVGEIAAAVLGGVMSLGDAVRFASARGALMASLPPGGMAAVALSEAEVKTRLTAHPLLDVGAVNTAGDVVVSGPREALDVAVAAWKAEGVRVTPLQVSQAFHSRTLEPILGELREVIAAIVLSPSSIPVLSNLTGRAETAALADPDYWVTHARQTVRFADGLAAAPRDALFLELGPHPVLSAFGARIRPDATFIPTLRRGQADGEALARAVGALIIAGVEPDPVAWEGGVARRRVGLPTTPWQRVRCWVDAEDAPAGALFAVRERPAPEGDSGRSWVLRGTAVAWADAITTAGDRVVDAPGPDAALVWGPSSPDETLSALAAARAAGAVLVLVGEGELAGALRGFAAGIAQEEPARAGGAVDTTGAAPADVVRALRSPALLRRAGADGPVQPTLVPVDAAPATVRGSWWITGGTGAVGRAIARSLRASGAERVVLTARSAAEGTLEPGVEVWPGDVTDETAMTAIVRRFDDGPPLRGVIHAAGVLADRLLVSLDADALASVWRPKVLGATVLDRVTASCELDAFVLITSAAGVLGWTGQAGYGASNAWLDAFAARRRGEGRPMVAVAFGPWDGEGMASPSVRAAMGEVGMRALPPASAVHWLRAALAAGEARLVAVDLDAATYVRRHPRAADLLGVRPATDAPASAERRVEDAATVVREEVAAVLGVADPATIDAGRGLSELGLDSLMAVSLARRISSRLGVSVPDTAAFDHGSIDAMVAAIGGVSAPSAAVAVQHGDEIVVVGLGCRLPGGVDGPEALWALMTDGTDPIGPVPRARWDHAAFYDPVPGTPGRTYLREGGFVGDVSGFDAQHFGLSPREARLIDPQQRLLLEVAWEALEHAAIAPDSLTRRRVAVMVGIGGHDYERIAERAGVSAEDEGYLGTGTDLAFAAGRIAYHLGAQGPAFSLDTACSSSLVAVHQAAQALRDGSADLALAGGVRLMLSPESTLRLSALRALSPSNRCHTFDAAADGYARSEGAGIVVLKRRTDAERDGDRILAVLEGSGVGHDGPSSGLTVPSGSAQATLLREVLGRAGVRAVDVDAIEAHGTGTALGDPIEIGALKAVFGDRPADRPLRVGALKAQIGHTELAAGVAGMIKAVLALQHERIPGQLHLSRLNPSIDVGWPVAIAADASAWPSTGQRRIGVNAFGLSGTNAHVLLREVPAPVAAASGRPRLLLVSAGSPDALDATSEAVAAALPAVDLDGASATLLLGRSRRRHRRAVVAATLEEAVAALRDPGRRFDGEVRRGVGGPSVGLLFTGQGSQRAGMARALYERSEIVRDVIDRCDAGMRRLRGEGLLPVLFPKSGGSPIDQTGWTQPALFAVEVAVASWWIAAGLRPTVLVGHSVGEIAAAVVSRALSLDDGLMLVEARGRLMQALPQDGAMAALALGEAEVAPHLVRFGGSVEIAAINAPDETVIAGDAAAVRAVLGEVEAAGGKGRELVVSHAFHSPKMAPMVDALAEVASRIMPGTPSIPVISALDGEDAGLRHGDAAFWARHAREGVRFLPAIRAAAGRGVRWFVEVGPHPVLCGLGARSVSEPGVSFVPSMRRGADDELTLLAGAARLLTSAVDLDPSVLLMGDRPARVALPRTAWSRERLWVDGGEAKAEGVAPAPGFVRRWIAGAGEAGPTRTWWWIGDRGGRTAEVAAALAARGHVVREVSADEAALAAAALVSGPEVCLLDGRPLDGEGGAGDALALLSAARGALGRDVPVSVLLGADGPLPGALEGLWAVLGAERPAARGAWVQWDGGVASDVAAILSSGVLEDGRVDALGPARLRLTRAVPGGALDLVGRAALITGGTGAVGLAVAEACADAGAAEVLLVARSAPSAVAAARIERLIGRGVAVQVLRGDVREAVGALTPGWPIGLAVHAAGGLEDAALERVTVEQIDRLSGPKVGGALALHAALPTGVPLVLIGSAAAVLGSAGQAAYAVANGNMAGLVGAFRADGRPTVALAFGPWAGEGMASGHLDAMRRRGIVPLTPASAAVAALRFAKHEEALVVVADADWAQVRAGLEGDRPRGLLDELAPAASPRKPAAAVRDLRAGVLSAVAEVLGRSDPRAVDPTAGFFDLGFDSLMSVQLVERLGRLVGRPLPSSLVFDHPTVDRLVSALGGEADPGKEVAAVGTPDDDPIVIVGLGCRFPGGESPDAFWRLLERGGCAVGEVSPNRWPTARALWSAEPGVPGRTYTLAGAYLDAIDQFDPVFFGISPREAESMDPQQRLLLEVVWEALQDAGLDPAPSDDAAVGVWVGMGASEYDARFVNRREPVADAWSGTGNDTSFAAGRIAYLLGLQGPAITVNTACSASLVAVHQAAQALRAGEVDAAIAAGVNLMVSPDSTVRLAQLRALSPTGLCRAFDADADGYVRGEGAGAVVLTRRSVAAARGWTELAVVRGSAVNHDGRASALTAPSGPAQTALLRAAWKRAGVTPEQLGYLEAHGTGTKLGDPIEARALAAALGERATPLPVGSVKTNVGHLELAAGMAGLIKTVLALRHGVIPAHLHLRRQNPEIPTSLPLRFPAVSEPWTGSRIAGVSSFGLSGTNAHIVLEAAPVVSSPAGDPAVGPQLVAVAARGPSAVERRASAFADLLAADPSALSVLAASGAAVATAHHRVAVVGEDPVVVTDALAGRSRDGRFRGEAGVQPPEVAWVFSGAGGLWPGFARPLMGLPGFAAGWAEAGEALRPRLGASIDELAEDPAAVASHVEGAALTFAWQVAMVRQLQAWGIGADIVVGHGAGELTAAWAAGGWSVDQAAAAVVARGQAVAASPEAAMVSCVGDAAAMRAVVAAHPELAVVAENAADALVVGGPLDAVKALAESLVAQGLVCLPLPGDRAPHGPWTRATADAFAAQVAPWRGDGPRWRTGETGEVVTALPAAAWAARLASPITFAAAARGLVADDPGVVLEIGPAPQLLGLLRRTLSPRGRLMVGLSRRGREHVSLLEAVAEAWVRGVPVSLDAISTATGRIKLPPMPYERRRCWVDEEVPAPAIVASPSPSIAAMPATDPMTAVRTLAAGLLGMAPTELPVDRPLAWLGLDSRMGIELHEAIGRQLGVSLSADAVLAGPSVRELATLVEDLRRTGR